MVGRAAPSPQMNQAPQPGALFGVPGVSMWTEQNDNNTPTAVTLNQANSVTPSGLINFTQTDVVFWWEMEVTISQTYTAGTSTITQSAYFPYSYFGESKLRIQNMYDSWHPFNGIDAAIWDMYRPPRSPDGLPVTNLNSGPQGTFITTTLAQANLDASSAVTTASTSVTFSLFMPVSMWFDVYYDLGKDGTILSAPHRALVSPQFMAGSARLVVPQLLFNPGSAATTDNGPANIGAGTGTFTGTATLNFKKVGVYGSNNPAVMPIVYAWQYQRESRPFAIGARSQIDFVIPTYGQILSLFVRLFDPAAAAGLGAPISIANVTKCEVRFGSGLFRFQDTPRSAQRRFLYQHGFLPPQGVFVWDFAVDQYGRTTNQWALNTLTTAGLSIHLEFSGVQSASSYAVVGVEALTFVE